MTDVTIIGGGLAGMTAALRLLERGCTVSLFEAGTRLGGKAGADRDGELYEEHGYHIFPLWYLNIYRIADDLGIRDNFIDISRFYQLRAGEFPEYKALRNFTSFLYALENIRAETIPPEEMFLFYYSVMDLLSQPYSRRAFLDQISVNGFVRSRFYRTERISQQYQDLLLKFISVPSYRVSAMTVKNMMNYWVKYSVPMHRILKGDLHRFFIAPLEQKLVELGCEITTSHTLERIKIENSKVKRVYLRNTEDNRIFDKEVDKVIIAIPPERLSAILDDNVYNATPHLNNAHYLRTEPMAALHIYLNRKISDIPAEHVNLFKSRFSLTFIDISQIWEGYDNTVLNIIASDFPLLEGLSPERATSAIIEELRRFLPIELSDIERTYFQSHVQEPLVTNDVGAWKYRPKAKTELSNLYLAGTYCRNHVDMTSMEGAVVTGLLAAESLRKDADIDSPVEILKQKVYPRWLFTPGKYALMPVAAFVKAVLELNRAGDSN